MSGGETDAASTGEAAKRGGAAPRGGRVNWRQVRILYRRELRAALRERAIVINSILIPLFLYPFILWAAFTGMLFVMGQTEGALSRVEARDWPKDHRTLRAAFEREKQIRLVEPKESLEAATNRIKEGGLDALVEFLPAAGTNAVLAGNFHVRITYNESKERSATAQKRVTAVLDEFRTAWLQREARERGISPASWERFAVSTQNVASKKQMGSFLLGLILPILFVVMVAIGCFYPAVDATAGERERSTWETLMSTAANRVSIVTAKYFYVTTLGGVAGALNLFAVIVTIKPIFAPLLAKAGDTVQFTLPLVALPVLALATVLLAGFVAAGMMIFASFARTFKEGQAMITPFYLLVLLPVMFLQVPGLKFSLPLAFIPIVNVTMMARSAVAGTLPWTPLGVTVVVSLLLIALCVRLAAFILRFEDVVVGSYRGGIRKFFQQRVLGRAKSTPPLSKVSS